MKMSCIRLFSSRLVPILLDFSLVGCATVATLTNQASPSCRSAFRDALESSLISQGETNEEAVNEATQYANSQTLFSRGPRPVLVSARSGTDYVFFIDKTPSVCLLRLEQRQKGFVRYSNNLTYIETRTLAGCECVE